VKLVAGPGGGGEETTEWVPPPANMESAPDGVTFSTPSPPSAMYLLPLESNATPTGLMLKFVAGAVGVVEGVVFPPPATRVIVAGVAADAGEAEKARGAEHRATVHTATPSLRFVAQVRKIRST
jgi:hypothetical protein